MNPEMMVRNPVRLGRTLSGISWESIAMVTEPNGRQWKHLDKVGSYNWGII